MAVITQVLSLPVGQSVLIHRRPKQFSRFFHWIISRNVIYCFFSSKHSRMPWLPWRLQSRTGRWNAQFLQINHVFGLKTSDMAKWIKFYKLNKTILFSLQLPWQTWSHVRKFNLVGGGRQKLPWTWSSPTRRNCWWIGPREK